MPDAATGCEVLVNVLEGFVTPTLFLRIASILTVVHCVLHTFGGVLGSPKHGAEEIAVIETMKSHPFDVMGSVRSYWDFFFGYGLFVTIFLLGASVLFWQLGSFAKSKSCLDQADRCFVQCYVRRNVHCGLEVFFHRTGNHRIADRFLPRHSFFPNDRLGGASGFRQDNVFSHC